MSVAVDLRVTHKPCPVPGCRKMIPLLWTFCKDRNCQSRRHLAKEATAEYWARKDAAERRKQMRARAYITAWKRNYSATLVRQRDLATINNHRLRRDEFDQAIRDGSAELRALIREQQDDDRRRSIGARLSLDQPLLVDSRRTLKDVVAAGESYLLAWHDPTGDAAVLRCEDSPTDVGDWNLAHTLPQPRIRRPLLTPYVDDRTLALSSPRKFRRNRRKPAGTTLHDHGKARNHGKRTAAAHFTSQTMKELRRTPPPTPPPR